MFKRKGGRVKGVLTMSKKTAGLVKRYIPNLTRSFYMIVIIVQQQWVNDWLPWQGHYFKIHQVQFGLKLDRCEQLNWIEGHAAASIYKLLLFCTFWHHAGLFFWSTMTHKITTNLLTVWGPLLPCQLKHCINTAGAFCPPLKTLFSQFRNNICCKEFFSVAIVPSEYCRQGKVVGIGSFVCQEPVTSYIYSFLS